METIKLFSIALSGANYDYQKIAELGLKTGYIVDKGCSTKDVYDFLQSQNINTNTTFYKTREDITSKNRFELFIDQVIHYFSTYGTDYEGKPYIPNDNYYNEQLADFKEFKKIKSATQEEIINRCNGLLGGVALGEETINDIFKIYDRFNYIPETKDIKNKEVKIKLYERYNLLPNDNDEMVRYLVYLATDKTLLVKDKETIQMIEFNSKDISEIVKKYGERKLSECFLRHKVFFLAFKKSHPNNKKLVNRLRRLAKENHKAVVKNPLDTLLATGILDGIDLDSLNNFKKISLLEEILNRKQGYKNYIIRNGKFWITQKTPILTNGIELYNKIYNSLVKSLSKYKGKTFYIPDYIDIKAPKSEKTFIGNYPIGTTINLENDGVVGISRKENDGTRDFDLSLIDIGGNKIGRNSSYNSNGIIYSGDMTSANPEATEMLYIGNNGFGIICVNRFNGDENSKYKFFVGVCDKSQITKNYMIKNEDIKTQSEMVSKSKEEILGFQIGKKIILTKLRKSNKIVSNGDTITKTYIDIEKSYKRLSIKELFLNAGMIETNREQAEIDLFDIKKDTIISLLQGGI